MTGSQVAVSGISRVVAFAGHQRSEDAGDLAAHADAITAALLQVWQAFSPPPLLMVGDAEGADQIAIDAWRSLGGNVSLVHPFLPEGSEALSAVADVWLDGASDPADSHPHLDQTRWLISHADLLVASWNGSAARGPGGTADAVALAVSADIPIVWIRSGSDGPARLIGAQRVADQTELAELAAGFGDMLPDATADAIAASTATGDPPANTAGVRRGIDRVLDATLWRAYGIFRYVAGGRPKPGAPPPPAPWDLAEQAGFAALTTLFGAAEDHANEQAAIHRSEQLLLILLAVLATAVGASPLPKLFAVVTEFSLAISAFLIWWTAERAHRHERWGLARHDAEQLRIARAAWAVGVRPWKGARGVAAVLPPTGEMDGARRLEWARWGLSELIDGQSAYHQRQGAIDTRITHRLELLENVTFALLLLTMTAVIIATAIHGGITQLPVWATDITVMVGALVPVIGAASMALEAKFGFSEHAARSRQLTKRLQEIAEMAPPGASLKQAIPAAREAIAALRAEGTLWAEGIHRRVLFRGG